MLIAVLIVLAVVVFLLLLLIVAGGMLIVIGGTQVGLIERRYVGRTMREGRVVAMKDEIGIQARILAPGLHILVPFLYVVRKTDMLAVNDDEVGLIESIDGKPLEPGAIFARHVAGHNSFQDGEAFLTNGGQKGPQVDIMPPGQYRINTYLFTIRKQPAVLIAKGQVGVVSARDGQPITPGRLLARRVEGHQAFQDGEWFLRDIGQLGPQIEVILPGRYRINTDLFKVEIHPATIVAANRVGLVTAKDGAPLGTLRRPRARPVRGRRRGRHPRAPRRYHARTHLHAVPQ